jgi:soluble lytic murein transglycosylase-like protein
MKIVFMLAMLLSSTQVVADIYKFVDTDGRIYYTDEPRNKLYKLIIKSLPPPLPSAFRKDAYKNQTFTGANKKRFTDLIEQAAYKHQVDAKLIHAVIQTESAYNADAQSPKGAVGLMQLMPDTAKRFGVIDRNDPDQNVDGGIRYLKHLIALFNPKIDLALAAYNAGENAVMRNNNTIPPYPETQNYVKQVLALYHKAL